MNKDKDIQLSVSYEVAESECMIEDDLKEITDDVKPANLLDGYTGIITLREYPLTFQKHILNEW